MQVKILNVKYSPNLGDGVIAECLEYALQDDPSLTGVDSCDLAGRAQYGDGVNQSRQFIRSTLSLFPGPIRLFLLRFILHVLIALKLDRHYRTALKEADLIIIGGGQLISDKDLNFPMKIGGALNVIAGQNVPVAVHGVGVAAKFTRTGETLFKRIFRDTLSIANVRDDRSVSRWNERFTSPTASKVWDPGILTSVVYPAVERQRPANARPLFGIGITNSDTLKVHSDSKDLVMDKSDWIEFYCELIQQITNRNIDVKLFTNGAYDDQVFAEQIVETYKTSTPDAIELALAPRGTTPTELAEIVSQFDGIVSHRLHANIMAYSYGIPHIGLGWDSKMQGFFDEVSRSDYLLTSVSKTDAASLAEKVEMSLQDPIDQTRVKEIQDETLGQVRDLVQNLKMAAPT